VKNFRKQFIVFLIEIIRKMRNNMYIISVRKPYVEKSHGKLGRRWEDNIKIYFRVIIYEDRPYRIGCN
jgi:hypothetical protein